MAGKSVVFCFVCVPIWLFQNWVHTFCCYGSHLVLLLDIWLSYRHWCACLSSHQGILIQLHAKEWIVSHETIWVCVGVVLHLHYGEGSYVYLPVVHLCSSHILVEYQILMKDFTFSLSMTQFVTCLVLTALLWLTHSGIYEVFFVSSLINAVVCHYYVDASVPPQYLYVWYVISTVRISVTCLCTAWHFFSLLYVEPVKATSS